VQFPSHLSIVLLGLLSLSSLWATGLGHPLPRRPSGQPRRVVSVGLVADEILLSIADREQLGGLTKLTEEPSLVAAWGPALAGIPRVASGPEPVLAAAPDLVVASRWSPQNSVEAARSSGIALLTLKDVTTLDDIVTNLLRVGHAIGQERRAEAAIATLNAGLNRLAQHSCPRPKRRVLLLGSGYAYGGETLQDDWLRYAGAVNVAAIHGKGALPLSEEVWLELNPDFILIETDGTRIERQGSQLLRPSALRPTLEHRFHRRIIGIPRVYSDSASTHVLFAIEAVSEVICSA
jgi:iron complex transport system substrate-binding protein